jgi:predicted transposase YdaD
LKMAKHSDITSKRLIAIAPEEWVRWATDVKDASNCEILSGEFQFVSRETDMLILVHESSIGEFLTLFEVQTRYLPEMPKRIRAYAALSEAKYDLPVFPILINILPYHQEIPEFYESNFLGIYARQDYRVINLWEIEAEKILEENQTALMPFLPAMKGGKNEKLVRQAQAQLQLDENLRNTGKLGDMQMALSLFTEAIFGKGKAKEILRWTMLDIIVESPLYQEIQLDGAKIESHNFLLRLLEERFGVINEDLKTQIKTLSTNQAEELGVKLFRVKTLEEFKTYLAEFDESPVN